MKTKPIATRIVAGVLPAMALFATVAAAQEAPVQTAPPPAPAAAAPEPVAPVAAAATPTAAPAPSGRGLYEASIAAATGPTADDAPPAAEPRAARAPVRASVARARPVTRAIPAQTTTQAATPTPPVVATSAPVEATAPAPAPVVASPMAQPVGTEATPQSTGTPAWLWLLGGLAALAILALGAFALRRRNADDELIVDQPYAIADEASLAAPLAHDEPVVEHADLVAPAADEVAAMTEAVAPAAADRPWIELSLRPLRAGATDESALVDLELTLANAGGVEARDVRVSTFMLGDATDAPTDMDRLLALGHAGTKVDAGSIAAGEGSRIDARLAVPREGMDGATFQPVVVADVRYTMPDGTQGRTAAAFTIGVHDDSDAPTPLRLGGDIRDDVEATLHGTPERV